MWTAATSGCREPALQSTTRMPCSGLVTTVRPSFLFITESSSDVGSTSVEGATSSTLKRDGLGFALLNHAVLSRILQSIPRPRRRRRVRLMPSRSSRYPIVVSKPALAAAKP